MIHENATAHPEQPVTAAVKLGVSVVICCHNSAKLLPPTLEHLRKQQVDPSIPWEAIIVDNASTDATAEIARKLWPGDAPAPLRIVREPQLGLSNARRRGFAEAKYEIVSFIDDDNWVANNWIDTVSKIMSASPVLGALGGLVYPVYEVEPPTWFHDYRHYCAIRTEEELTRFPGSQDTLVGAV